MEAKLQKQVNGYRTQDGANVSLVRVLGPRTMDAFDPILMLDSFDSENPNDYIGGFPRHPHRGIETISYIYQGNMLHKDSLGNEDRISDGEVQWMTAGSGILHEEQLPASKRMLGVQLWLNLPANDKMVPPAYRSIKKEDIQEIPFEGGYLRLLAGSYKQYQGFKSHYLPLDYYDIHLNAHGNLTIQIDPNRSIMLFTLLHEVFVGDERIQEKTAVKLTPGSFVTLKATSTPAQVLFVSSMRLDESVAWGGPIVMNTKEELNQAFDELKQGTFLKEDMLYDEQNSV